MGFDKYTESVEMQIWYNDVCLLSKGDFEAARGNTESNWKWVLINTEKVWKRDVCLLSKGDFESKDGSCFWLLKISALPSNPIFNPFPHQFRVAKAISKNATEFFIVSAGILQDSEGKTEH